MPITFVSYFIQQMNPYTYLVQRVLFLAFSYKNKMAKQATKFNII